ncbi:sensor histidine kinase [Streptomyces sp. NPDC002044]|uniref:sensor histidine kinase n=1 Tax=Streptomyces sp. NPDC002044 TaxID=3154662 RepID=UPI00331EBF84
MGEQRERPGSPWRRWVERTGRGPAWRSTLAVAVLAQLGAWWAGQAQTGRVTLDWFGRLLLLLGPALLLLRHRHPVAVAFGVSAVTLAYLGAGFPRGPEFLSLGVACFAAVVAGHRWAAWGSVGLVWAGHLLVGHWLYRWLPPPGDGPASWVRDAGAGGWILGVLALFELVRVRREQWSRERAARVAAERTRVDEARLRITRELHDVLAHGISVINVQAGVGLALLDTDPEQARAALTTIKETGKEALGEVRQVLDILRAPGEAPRAPAPGLDRIPELVEQAAADGLAVEVTAEGTARPLPPGVDLAAFRIVQEALANVLRHSGGRSARVRLVWRSRALDVRVEDDGPSSDGPAPGTTDGGGDGLVGMRERVAALGGTLETGPRPEGGYAVSVTLPLEALIPREDQWPPA